jgi:hypothetical protein
MGDTGCQVRSTVFKYPQRSNFRIFYRLISELTNAHLLKVHLKCEWLLNTPHVTLSPGEQSKYG